MSGEAWVISSPETLNAFYSHVTKEGFATRWKLVPDVLKRSTSANALYWSWLDVMARHFSKQAKYTKDDMHDLMRHQFLGYVDKCVGKTEIQPQLRSTTKLTVAAMCHYMSQIDAWAADHGCLLPRPADNEYAQYREAQS